MSKPLDLITIGRSSVDLYGAQIGGRLEDMGSFDKYIGGSPTNIACGTARLGLRSAVITGVGDEHMGRFIREQLEREGVDTRGVKTDPERLTALVILGIRDQEQFPLIFYRENCADMGLTVEDIDPEFVREARAVVATGTHLSHRQVEAATIKALEIAREAGLQTALDIDYRPNLWGVAGHGEGESRFVASERVTEKLQSTLHLFDLIVGTEEEFHIAGGTTDTVAALRSVRAVSGATLVCKRGARGAVAFGGDIPDSLDHGETGPGFPIEVFNVLGAGDGFMSGLLKGWLDGESWPIALKYANACGAFAVSRHGCTPAYPSWEELKFFLERGIRRPDLRNDLELEQVHWATNRKGDWSIMRVFAFDHRSQMEELDGATPEKIGRFKELCLDATLQVQAGRSGYGILCDGRLGREALYRAEGQGLWIGRPVERPGSRPLTLEPQIGPDYGRLREWPRDQVVKCLCFCHPDDDAGMWEAQEQTVLRLFHAARRNALEFLLEVIPSKCGPVGDDTAAKVIQRFYDLGVFPDWWKLEPFRTEGAWQQAVDAVERNDPRTRGIVVLGLDAPEKDLATSFSLAAKQPLVKGFAVGRTIFGQAARGWMTGEIADHEAVRLMSDNFSRLCTIWDKARFGTGEQAAMSKTIRLTAAQAMVKWLSVQRNADGARFIDGVWAIFGHGNVAGLGEALHGIGDALPTWRGQSEQTMAHTAIAFAKASKRRRAMAVTSSIGPGATNMVTAAALAHVNRLPLLLIPGDVFANRAPDPVLQQIEDFDDGLVSANDCFRPVSRYFDRISRPEHLLTALPRALQTMTDPAKCGPVTLAFCQDVQAEAYDYPENFFEPKIWRFRRPEPDREELGAVLEALIGAERPVIIAGGGVIYSGAEETLLNFARTHNMPFCETQAGKGAVDWSEELNLGSPGVTGGDAANKALAEADLILGVGTRFQDFTTGSWTVFANPKRRLVSINVTGYDAAKHGALSLVADARVALDRLGEALRGKSWAGRDSSARAAWYEATEAVMAAPNRPGLPTDAQVIGAVQRQATSQTVVMCAAGTMPGALHTLWRSSQGGYHMEYGFSCMGYEIAGAMGVKLARPEADIVCFVGDGSYMMANSELATAVMRQVPFTVVLTDNRGFGCINRLQKATGGAEFNNLYASANVEEQPEIDFVAHAAAMGAYAVKAADIAELEAKIADARARQVPSVIVIETDPHSGTGAGGHWWDVAVPEISERPAVRKAREEYIKQAALQRVD